MERDGRNRDSSRLIVKRRRLTISGQLYKNWSVTGGKNSDIRELQLSARAGPYDNDLPKRSIRSDVIFRRALGEAELIRRRDLSDNLPLLSS